MCEKAAAQARDLKAFYQRLAETSTPRTGAVPQRRRVRTVAEITL